MRRRQGHCRGGTPAGCRPVDECQCCYWPVLAITWMDFSKLQTLRASRRGHNYGLRPEAMRQRG